MGVPKTRIAPAGLAALSLALILVAVSAAPASAAQPGPACPSKVLAFYYGWHGGAPEWRHWASSDPSFYHDPERIVDSGSRYPDGVRRDIAATDYPALGPYDSQDPALIDRHLAWAERAGIDALISSWWGPGSYEDQTLGLLLDRIEASGSRVKAAVYLETWALFNGQQFQPSFFADPRNFTPRDRAEIRAKAVEWLTYLLTTYGDDPSLFRARKGGERVPVVFVYTAGLLSPPEWEEIFAAVRERTGIDAYYQADVEGVDFSGLASVFDGIHLYMPAFLTAEGSLSAGARAANPQATVKNPAAPLTDPVSVGTDYRALSSEARAMQRSWAATVIPGFDDRQVRNPGFWVSRSHGDGLTYDYFWRESLQSHPDWLLITSFNEWHEGSEIEPSVEYGRKFLRRTRHWTRSVHACRSHPTGR